MAARKDGRQARMDRERMLVLKHKFEHRITIAKYGKESMKNGNYTNAISKYIEYLQVMADVKRLSDFYQLTPHHFDQKRDLTEMLMISHIFLEMARIYDAIPKFAEEAQRCLDQFVAFTINQPYQVVNSEMVRKLIKKGAYKNAEVFRLAYLQIFVQSKKCYVVTFCYGTDHQTTQDFRQLKEVLLETNWGRELVRIYYQYSSTAVERWERSLWMSILASTLIKPFLALFSKTLLRFIIR